MAGFTYRKNLDGSSQSPTVKNLIGANSVVFQIGDLVRVNTSGFGALVTEGDVILGVVVGVTDKNGGRIDPDSGTLDTYTMASDNQTVAQKKVHYIPALPNYLFYNDADGNFATTNLFQFADVNDENDIKTSTLHDSTVSQVRIVELDPDGDGDASKCLCQIVESFYSQSTGSGGVEA